MNTVRDEISRLMDTLPEADLAAVLAEIRGRTATSASSVVDTTSTTASTKAPENAGCSEPVAAFTIGYQAMAAAVSAVALGINPRADTPNANAFLVEVDGHDVRLTAYDGETLATIDIPAIARQTGRTLLDHAEIRDLLSSAAKGERKSIVDAMIVDLGSLPDTNLALLRIGGFSVTLDGASSPGAAPELPAAPKKIATVERAAFVQAASQVLSAVGRIKAPMTHLQFDVDPSGLTLRCTDMTRIATAQIPPFGRTTRTTGLIRGDILAEAIKHMDGQNVTLRAGGRKGQRRAHFDCDLFTFSTAIAEGSLPNFGPLTRTTVVTVNVSAMSKAIRQAAALARSDRPSSGFGSDYVAVEVDQGKITIVPSLSKGPRIDGPSIPAALHGSTTPGFTIESGRALDGIKKIATDTVSLHLGPMPGGKPDRSDKLLTLAAVGESLDDPGTFRYLMRAQETMPSHTEPTGP